MSSWKWILRRKQYFINKRFQFRFIAYFLIAECALCSVFIYFGIRISQESAFIANQISSKSLQTSPVNSTLFTNNIETWIYLGGLLLLASTLLFVLIMILYSHSIAGPVFSLQRHLQAICDNNFNFMKIRKKDSFQDLPDSVNKLIKSLIDNQKTDLIELQDALNTFESHTENGKEKIREIIRKKQEILKTTKENKTE